MKSLVNVFAILAVLVFSANVVAQETSNEEKCSKCPAQSSSVAATAGDDAKCSKCPAQSTSVATTACDDADGCPVTAAMAKLPKMTYVVGEESTCCEKSAAALAEKSENPVRFVVGEATFDDKEKAFVSLVEQTESFVNDFITPSKCEKSGTHSIAGTSCKCPVEAGQKAELVKAAVDEVKMTYVVGKESCSCSKMAGEMAEKSGEKMTYKVGEEATCCSLDARLKLAQAKYKAAVQAMVAASQPAEKAEATTETSGT